MAPLTLGSGASPVGLDIGTDYARAALVKSTGSGPSLTHYGRVELPFGAVVEGEILDPGAVGAAIGGMWKSAGFKTKQVAIGVANQKVVVRLIDLPFMEKAELQGAIQYQAQDYIPIPIEEAILSFDVISDYMTPSDEHMMEVLLVAAQRDMINNAVEAVDAAGLKLERIDLTAFALVRSVLGVDTGLFASEESGQATAILQLTSGLSSIVVVERGVPRFNRVSSLAGNQFTQAIANVLNLTYDEAEALKIRVGLPSLDGTPSIVPGVDPEMLQVAQQALEREMNRFIAEVRRSLDYYLTQTTQVRTISRIVLTGSAAMLKNLPSYLEKGLQTEVILGDPLGRIALTSSVEAAALDDRMGSASAIGLALGE